MSVAQLTISPPSLPADYCFTTWQQFVNDSIGKALVNFDTTGLTGVLNQTNTPLATQRSFLWNNPATGHLLSWNNTVGSWVARHPQAPGSLRESIWRGDTTALLTEDGGAAGTVGDAAGPFWEVDPDFAGRVPVGVGALPDVVNGIVNIALSATGGHNELAVVRANLPTDSIPVQTSIIGQSGVTGGGPQPIVGSTYGSDAIPSPSGACDATSQLLSGCYYTRGQTLALGSGTALNIINPYVGVYWIRRTARIYFTS